MDTDRLKQIAEAILLAAARPLTLDQLLSLFEENERPERADMRKALEALQADFEGRGIELVQVASGYRIQVADDMQPWVSRLWEEKPARYSRALLETLALIAYRQPITRGEIEDVRGVSVSSSIMKTLQEREWVRVVGHREVPGRPAMYGTTKEFLDYFSLKSLDELPSLAELRDLSTIGEELQLDLSDIPEAQQAPANDASEPEETAEVIDLSPVPDTAEDDSPATLH
jgi:segregation and condensation protein B